MDHEKWPKTEPDELIAYLRRKFKQCDCPGCEECKSYENAANLIESSLLKLEASVKAHNEIFDALRDCEEKRNEQSSRLDQVIKERDFAIETSRIAINAGDRHLRRLGSAPCKRLMLQETPYNECFPADNCLGCDCWRSAVETPERKYAEAFSSGDRRWHKCADPTCGMAVKLPANFCSMHSPE